jgi:hypothetical protein
MALGAGTASINYFNPLAPRRSGGGSSGGDGSFGLPPLPDPFGGQGGPRQVGFVYGSSTATSPAPGLAGQAGAGGFGLPGSGGGAPAPPPAPIAGTGATTNYAQDNSNLKWLEEQYKQRFGSDPTQRAIERSTSNIRDTASGLMKEAQANAARRGVYGQGDSGILSSAEGKIADAAQRAAAGAGAGIALGREQDLDKLTAAGPAVLGANPQLQLQQQNLGLAQQQMGQQAQLAQMQANMQQQQMIANLWGSYLGALR